MKNFLTFPALVAVLALGAAHAQAGEKAANAVEAVIIGGAVVGGAALALKPHHHKHHPGAPLPDHRFDQGMSYPTTIPLAPGPVILSHPVGSGVHGSSDRPGPIGTGVSPQSSSPIGAGVSPQSTPQPAGKPSYDPYHAH
ncbi:hypothetical protein [Brucella pseudogrignonensis]|uniref:hypothetical protein n=1 Tax=Brucella pseudogrignonensis TaxID=419475 RepID=UPI00124D06C3|nr:hypothetical protein [Brucella pseudogrignonensis]KAB2689219.1 hypothetical protein F9K82_11300 [Brucella pseudogrignonensis]